MKDKQKQSIRYPSDKTDIRHNFVQFPLISRIALHASQVGTAGCITTLIFLGYSVVLAFINGPPNPNILFSEAPNPIPVLRIIIGYSLGLWISASLIGCLCGLFSVKTPAGQKGLKYSFILLCILPVIWILLFIEPKS